MENGVIIETFLGKFDKILAGFGAVFQKQLQVNIAKSGIQDHLIFLFCQLQLFFHIVLFFANFFIHDIPHNVVGWAHLRRPSAENIETRALK